MDSTSTLFQGILILALPLTAFGQPNPAAPTTMRSGTGQCDVTQFGAMGDGKTDATAAFQQAMDKASAEGGGVVAAPRGNFLFRGHLRVPNAVTLRGIWESVPSHNGIRDRGLPKPTDDGTTFLITEGAGSEDGDPFITLNTNSTVRFPNCAFWGPCNQIAGVAGRGPVGFSNCTFVQWDLKARDGRAALQIQSGTVLVRGCEFRQAGAQISLGEAVRRAVITGNVITGPTRITNASKGSVHISDNADSPAVPGPATRPGSPG